MSHSSRRCREEVDSRPLGARSQTANLTPGPSFAHNLGYRCPNDQCEAIFDIYVSRPFQWHQEHPKARWFGPCYRALNIRESQRTPNPQLCKCWASPLTLGQNGVAIASLTPGPSFAHNLGCRCPNGQCEAIFDIYVSRPFQWQHEHLNARCFGPCCRALNIRESQRAPNLQLFQVLGFTPTLGQSGVVTSMEPTTYSGFVPVMNGRQLFAHVTATSNTRSCPSASLMHPQSFSIWWIISFGITWTNLSWSIWMIF